MPSAENARPEISLWSMPCCEVSSLLSSTSWPVPSMRYSTNCVPPLTAPSHRWPLVGSIAKPDQVWMLNGAVMTANCAPLAALSSTMRLPGPLFSVR